MKEYLTYIILLIAATIGGAWLNSQLQPIIDLEWIQQSLIGAVSYLFGYVIFVWGYILVTAVFVKEGKNAGELIGIGALVGIPLSIIVGLVIGAI
jgi:hypothetical protein